MKTLKLLLFILSCLIIMGNVIGQSPVLAPVTTSPQDPLVLGDTRLAQKVQEDLSKRNSTIGKQTVRWFDNGYGYYGTYTIDDKTYMTRYNRKGKYVETLVNTDWNDTNVPASVRTSLAQSEFGSNKVTDFWKVTDGKRTTYYLELLGENGETARIWTNESGEFFNDPPEVRKASKKRRARVLTPLSK